MGQASTMESWLGNLRGRYPNVRVIAWVVFLAQAFITIIQWAGRMIDAYGHAQFYFDHRQVITHGIQSIIAAFFSPSGSIITMLFCGAFLFFDNRARKHQLPIPGPQDSSSAAQVEPTATLTPVTSIQVAPFDPVPISQKEIFKRSTAPGDVQTDKWFRRIEQQWRDCGVAIQRFAESWSRFLRDQQILWGRPGLLIDAQRDIIRARDTFTAEIISLLVLLGRKVEAEIEILNISNDQEVAREHIVRGIARPLGTLLHVRVRTGDGRWWRQDPPIWNGSLWNVNCRFGPEQGPLGGTYKIVAILGDTPSGDTVTEAEIQPAYVVRSNVVSVRKTKTS